MHRGNKYDHIFLYHHHHCLLASLECVVPNVASSFHSGQFSTASSASVGVTLFDFRSLLLVLARYHPSASVSLIFMVLYTVNFFWLHLFLYLLVS